MTSESVRVSSTDISHLELLRAHVSELWAEAAAYAGTVPECVVLDIAPQDHRGVGPLLTQDTTILTLDIDPESGADVIGDICTFNRSIEDASFAVVVCTEVLEHVSNPFAAVSEILRMLKPDGRAYFSAPLNFRIHGPLPDNWRFTEHGWRQLLSPFSKVDIRTLETPDRSLMPIHYNVVATR